MLDAPAGLQRARTAQAAHCLPLRAQARAAYALLSSGPCESLKVDTVTYQSRERQRRMRSVAKRRAHELESAEDEQGDTAPDLSTPPCLRFQISWRVFGDQTRRCAVQAAWAWGAGPGAGGRGSMDLTFAPATGRRGGAGLRRVRVWHCAGNCGGSAPCGHRRRLANGGRPHLKSLVVPPGRLKKSLDARPVLAARNVLEPTGLVLGWFPPLLSREQVRARRVDPPRQAGIQ